MQEITIDQTLMVCGGLDTGGYNFSFIVQNTISGCILGIPAAILLNSWNPISSLGAVFGGYAVLMMIAKTIDSYVFIEDPSDPLLT